MASRDHEAEIEEQELQGDPEQDRPRAQVSEVATQLAEFRARHEAAAMAQDFHLSPQAVKDPGGIAAEMAERARHIRTRRAGLRTGKLELAMLEELDMVAGVARELEEARRARALDAATLSEKLTLLSALVFAARLRFADLADSQDAPFVYRAARPSPEARQRELGQIDEFLARRAQRVAA